MKRGTERAERDREKEGEGERRGRQAYRQRIIDIIERKRR